MSHFVFAKTSGQPQFTDAGSHAHKDVSFFFAPQQDKQQYGTLTLSDRFGQSPVAGYPASAIVYPVSFALNPSACSPIRGGSAWWTRLWSDRGSGRPDDYTCWRVNASMIPSGSVCVSPCFFKVVKGGGGHSLNVPPTDEEVAGMVAVREDLVSFVPASSLKFVWDDRGTHAKEDLSIYTGPDSLGCFGFPNYDPPTGNIPILDRSKGRLILSWERLEAAVQNFTGVQLTPSNIRGDRNVMSSNQTIIKGVWKDNQPNFRPYSGDPYDCEDFAFEMRAAAARRCHDDNVSNAAKVGCFCGVVYCLLNEPNAPGHGLNLVLLPDESLALFEPQTGDFESKQTVRNFLAVLY